MSGPPAGSLPSTLLNGSFFTQCFVGHRRNPELAAGLAQAEMMIEDVRMDCARRVAEAEASRQTAEDEAGQLRRALRNAVDELQRTVTEVCLYLSKMLGAQEDCVCIAAG